VRATLGDEPEMAAGGLDSRWLAAALPTSLVFVGPRKEIEISIDGDTDVERALDALTPRLDERALKSALGATDQEVRELVGELVSVGALTSNPADGRSAEPAESLGLGAALLAVVQGESLTAQGRALVVTADELLALPASMGIDLERRALHGFVGAIVPEPRLRAYCRVATDGVMAVRGDRPDPRLLAQALLALNGLDEALVHAIAIADCVSATVAPEDLGQLGFDSPHRLGPLETVGPLERPPVVAGRGMHVYGARYAVANLRFPSSAAARLGGGRAAVAELAELIARAEAAERYGAGDVARHELVRARAEDLDAPFVAHEELFSSNARQRRDPCDDLVPYDPAAEHLWTPGRVPTGERRWVPADAVFYPLFDPRHGGRTLPTSSSGSAAHTTLAEARSRALCELVERDAFMWTWIQRVARERIDERSLPAEVRSRAEVVRHSGMSISFVNLTLDLLPVLACVIHSTDRLSLALACSIDPAAAVGRALNEAIGLIELIERGRLGPIAPEDVTTPEQHAALHLDPERIEQDRFLFGTDDEIALADVVVPGSPDELVATVGEPVTVDLSSPATAPFHVARVLVPNLIPISFGFDREPLGMPRLAEPKRVHDGRTLGKRLDLLEAGPLDPHPFA